MNNDAYKLKYLKYKSKYFELKDMVGGYMFEIKKDHGSGNYYIKKNQSLGISGGCGIEAVLNIFNLNWKDRKSKKALSDFTKQTGVCRDARRSGDAWTDDISLNLEQLINILVANGINIGKYSNSSIEIMYSNPLEFLTETIINDNPFITQEYGGLHFKSYRSNGRGKYIKIDAYSDEIQEYDKDELITDLEDKVNSGEITSIYKIVPK